MRRILPAVAFLLSASALCAQLPTLETKTVIGVTLEHRTTSTKRYYKSIPAKTKLTTKTHINAFFSNGYFGPSGSASTAITPVLGSTTSYIGINEGAYGTDRNGGQLFASTSQAAPKQAHEWLLKIPARARGNVLAISANAAMPPLVRAGFAIDVDDNGTYEFVQAWNNKTQTKSLTLGTKAVVVRIVSYAQNGWASQLNHFLGLELILNPRPPVQFRRYGTGCGATLSATNRTASGLHNILIAADGIFQSQPALVVYGLRAVKLPIYPRGCELLVDPLYIHPVLPGSVTYLRMRAYVPISQSGKIRMQIVSRFAANGFTNYRTSNGLEADFGN